MIVRKEIKDDNELYLYFNDKLIYKRWLNYGYSKVFDKTAYGKDTFVSIIEDENGKIRHRRKIFINGDFCETKEDFWNKYVAEIDSESGKLFGKNLDAFNDWDNPILVIMGDLEKKIDLLLCKDSPELNP